MGAVERAGSRQRPEERTFQDGIANPSHFTASGVASAPRENQTRGAEATPLASSPDCFTTSEICFPFRTELPPRGS